MFSTVRTGVFHNLFKRMPKRGSPHMDAEKGTKKGGRTVFRLVIEPGEARVRKTSAPAGRAMTPLLLKKPRRRPDFFAEAQDE
jgi:hypothetical protein